MKWQKIETAPIGMKMFVVIAFDVPLFSTGAKYTSDPYCVWQPEACKFERWPHPFMPTHWAPLPEL